MLLWHFIPYYKFIKRLMFQAFQQNVSEPLTQNVSEPAETRRNTRKLLMNKKEKCNRENKSDSILDPFL